MAVSRRDWLRGSMMAAGLATTTGLDRTAGAGTTERVEIWPGGTGPGSEGAPLEQRMVARSHDPARPDRYMEGITRPFLTIYRPARPDGRALLIIPGGGYQRVVVDKEGGEVGPLLAARGFTCFVLTYRLPGEVPQHGPAVALQDAQRAMRVIRSQAGIFGIDGGAPGVMGFSAGGHVAAMLGTRHADTTYAAVDQADRLPARPARLALIYPVIGMGTSMAHRGSRDRLLGPSPTAAMVERWSADHQVTTDTPPVFLLHATDDQAVLPENSLAFHAACRRAGVPAELHLYPKGGHGFGHGDRIAADNPLRRWPDLFLEWQAPAG
ncbi:alpha/beta hydrolase [Niveispirillum fermenti]|uniref:alpha/beta hydrolase n=1 Tax=Niveispirillum fermenti TaxID=1233113 RepID=UPI003A8AF7F5